MDPITGYLLELAPDTVTIESATGEDAYGAKTYGTVTAYPAKIVGSVTRVRDLSGQERVSTVQVVFMQVTTAQIGDRFTLPDRFEHRQPVAIAIDRVSDENGPHHEKVYF